MRCSSCARPLQEDARYCPACGRAVDVADSPTGTAPRPSPAPPSPGAPPGTPRGSSSAARRGPAATRPGRFASGELLAGRYRIVALLGKGGMGEVYRADDLTLDQPVALKFLPEALQHDAERRERFYQEVRVARQVSHSAVCRVYDVMEAEGHLFLSMEYVDGEDLATLLRRIGRVPHDKAVEIARQLCAGLAAAHDRGVLHRDLKPANVMLDGRGTARITDFGLAALASNLGTEDARSGTPAYMAPEQLDGREVSARSDIYALGLVLYELFTGRRAFEGRTYTELAQKHRERAPDAPSRLVDDIEPAVERVILRCLAKDAGDRPRSPLAVAAALPGSDPLAAALAAGETPSPELVAAAGEGEGLGRAWAWAALLLSLAGLAAMPRLSRSLELHRLVPMTKPPAVLEDRAREIVQRFGYTELPVDSALGFSADNEYLRRLGLEHSADRWASLADGRPPAVRFWYRQSPRPLIATSLMGEVGIGDPPETVTDMVSVTLDTQGRLERFQAVPPQLETAAGPSPEPDWSLLFEEAKLEMDRFEPVEPRWTPAVYADTRAAWTGSYGEPSGPPLRVEAGAYRGRPVFFSIVYPWTRPGRQQPYPRSAGQRAGLGMIIALVVTLIAVAGVLARRNVARGKGHSTGAVRLAAYALVSGMLGWLLSADHVPDLAGEVTLAVRGCGTVLLMGGITWTFYLALEPYVRKRWPHVLISWTRLLTGRLWDALVARDVLVGIATGTTMALVTTGVLVLARAHNPLPPRAHGLELLAEGVPTLMATLVFAPLHAATGAMGLLLLVLLLRLWVRNQWLAVSLALALACLPESLSVALPFWIVWPFDMLLTALPFLLLVRFGLLPAAICLLVVNSLMIFPLTDSLGDWTAAPTLALLALLSIGAVWAFKASSRAVRPLPRSQLAAG